MEVLNLQPSEKIDETEIFQIFFKMAAVKLFFNLTDFGTEEKSFVSFYRAVYLRQASKFYRSLTK